VTLALVRCAGLLYGIDVRWVQETQPLTQITPVYGLPDFWVGLTALRGQIYAVLDLPRVLSPQQGSAKTGQQIVFTAVYHLSVGLLVEEVLTVCQVDGQMITAVSTPHPPYIIGMTLEQVSLIDLPGLLADPRLNALENRDGGAKP
jgi:chemotaxis signal transduction protein